MHVHTMDSVNTNHRLDYWITCGENRSKIMIPSLHQEEFDTSESWRAQGWLQDGVCGIKHPEESFSHSATGGTMSIGSSQQCLDLSGIQMTRLHYNQMVK